MRNKHYKTKCFRLSDEISAELKASRELSKLSWNLYFKAMLKKAQKQNRDNKHEKEAKK